MSPILAQHGGRRLYATSWTILWRADQGRNARPIRDSHSPGTRSSNAPTCSAASAAQRFRRTPRGCALLASASKWTLPAAFLPRRFSTRYLLLVFLQLVDSSFIPPLLLLLRGVRVCNCEFPSSHKLTDGEPYADSLFRERISCGCATARRVSVCRASSPDR